MDGIGANDVLQYLQGFSTTGYLYGKLWAIFTRKVTKLNVCECVCVSWYTFTSYMIIIYYYCICIVNVKAIFR